MNPIIIGFQIESSINSRLMLSLNSRKMSRRKPSQFGKF
jgi:hypothetical protein